MRVPVQRQRGQLRVIKAPGIYKGRPLYSPEQEVERFAVYLPQPEDNYPNYLKKKNPLKDCIFKFIFSPELGTYVLVLLSPPFGFKNTHSISLAGRVAWGSQVKRLGRSGATQWLPNSLVSSHRFELCTIAPCLGPTWRAQSSSWCCRSKASNLVSLGLEFQASVCPVRSPQSHGYGGCTVELQQALSTSKF